MRTDIVQLFASESEVDATGHNGNDTVTINERPNTRSAASTIVATNFKSGRPGKGKGN